MKKNLVPKRRFDKFGGNWKEVQLSLIANVIGGGTPSTSIEEYWNGEIDWYSPTEIGKQIYATGSNKRITNLGLKKSSATILPAHKTILFTSRAGIGDMAILAKDGATNQGFQSLVLKDNFDVYFVFSMGYKIKEYALINASGSTFLEVSGKTLEKMKVFLPFLQEQQKIGEFFKVLDERIANQERKIAKIKALKSAYLTEMFPQDGETVPKRRFKGFEGEWKECKLGEVSRITAGGDVNSEKLLSVGKFPVIANSLSNDGIMGYYNDKYQVTAPAVTVTGRGDIGHAKARLVNFTAIVRLLVIKSNFDVHFLENLINNVKIIVESTGVPQLTVPQLGRIKVRLPKIEEQQKIGQFFKNIDEQIATEEKKLEKLKKMKEAYLEEMFV